MTAAIEKPQLDALVELCLNGPIRSDLFPVERCEKLGFSFQDVELLISRGLAARVVVKKNPDFIAATMVGHLYSQQVAPNEQQ